MLDILTFWKLLGILRGESHPDITTSLSALVKSEKGKVTNFFSNVIDQIAYNSSDYQRIRDFLIDWYSSLRTMSSTQRVITDPFSLSNSELDELFRSFGYNYSTDIRGFTNDPLTVKVNFFLDLVNLYKIKGTPQALFEVLQYYGLTELDLYEFWVEKSSNNELVFRGEIVIGTTGDLNPIQIPFDQMVVTDPHWRYTASQILTLNNLNKINLPSKSPYFAVKPIFEPRGSTSVLINAVQEQYFDWYYSALNPNDRTPPPQNANVTLTGSTTSLLGLYLSCIYFFNKEYLTYGSDSTNNFLCYDGTNTSVSAIIEEYDNLVDLPFTRSEQKIRLSQFYDLFTREKYRNFLQTRNSAEEVLDVLDPDLKSELNALGETNNFILSSLMKDLGDWTKINLSYGFINIALMITGIDAVFSDLRNAISFFKPYHARLIPIEAITARSRLFDSFITEDSADVLEMQEAYDYVTANGQPCCADDELICPDATTADQYYQRETYDCGSYHDIGAVTDIKREVTISLIDEYYNSLCCVPADATTSVESWVIQGDASSLMDGTTYGIIVAQSGGFTSFDNGAIFDCTFGFDLSLIEILPAGFSYLLMEQGGYILQENGSLIQLEQV